MKTIFKHVILCNGLTVHLTYTTTENYWANTHFSFLYSRLRLTNRRNRILKMKWPAEP